MLKRAEKLRLLLEQRPILQSPMAGAQGHELAVAVNKAGGIGAIPCAMLNPQQIREECSNFMKKASSVDAKDGHGGGDPVEPILNLNFFCHKEEAMEPATEKKWTSLIEKYQKELGFDTTESSSTKPPVRKPFNEASLEAVLEVKPTIVSFHFGLPEKSLLDKLRRELPETIIISSATTPLEALFLEEHGVDGIIAQGSEAGGHRAMFLPSSSVPTQIGLFALLPLICSKVKVPIIAAGGICDEGSILAAKALGASAVQVGSCLLLTQEAKTSSLHRAALQEGGPTSITNVFTGKPARGLVNRLMVDLHFINTEVVPSFPAAADALSRIRPQAEAKGIRDFSPLWSGQRGTGPHGKNGGSAEALVRELVDFW